MSASDNSVQAHGTTVDLHESEDSHHGGTALVELNGTLLELGLRIEGVPAKVDGSVAEVTDVLTRSGDVTHDHLEEEDEACRA